MKTRLTPDEDDKVSLLYRLGHSTYQIADQMGIERDWVRTALRRTGTPRRSITEAMKLRRAFA